MGAGHQGLYSWGMSQRLQLQFVKVQRLPLGIEEETRG